jgi:hypothetical protein
LDTRGPTQAVARAISTSALIFELRDATCRCNDSHGRRTTRIDPASYLHSRSQNKRIPRQDEMTLQDPSARS